MSSHDIGAGLGGVRSREATRRREPARGPHRSGGEPGGAPGGEPVGAGALAVVDLTVGCTPAVRKDLVEAAHGASRMGVVVLLVRSEDRAGVDAQLMDSVTRNGLGRGGVRCEVLGSNEPFPFRYRFAPLRITAASIESLPDGGEEVLSLEVGLKRLRELGRGPVFRGPDPVFRPLPTR
jgi:hypothetical protein